MTTNTAALAKRKPRQLFLGAKQGNELVRVVSGINTLAQGRDCAIETLAKLVRMPAKKLRNVINRQACNVQTAPGVELLRTFSYNGGGGNGKLVSVRLANTAKDAALVAENIAREERLAGNHQNRAVAIRTINGPRVGRRALALAERVVEQGVIEA